MKPSFQVGALRECVGCKGVHEPEAKLLEGGFYRGLCRGTIIGFMRGILGVWTRAHMEYIGLENVIKGSIEIFIG